MENCFKATVLLAFMLLSWSMAGEEFSESTARIEGKYVPGRNVQASVAGSGHIKFLFLAKAPEVVGNVYEKSFPRPKNPSTAFVAVLHALGHRTLCLIRQYLLKAGYSCRGLRGSELIFPFHYFW